MRNEWYGDHRDLVKWGALVQLARKTRLRFIYYVAYVTRNEIVSKIASELGETTIPSEVLQHFRDIKQIRGLATLTKLNIEVFCRRFEAKTRGAYGESVVKRIQSPKRKSWIVFLDPDTGLKDAQSSSSHVTPDEVRRIWEALRPRDWLGLYQHGSRERKWIEKRRKQFADNTSHDGHVTTFRSLPRSRDVRFFAASRNVSSMEPVF